MSRKYCVACGEQKRLTWPGRDPQVCTKHCAAEHFLLYSNTESVIGHCTWCGEWLGMDGGEHDFEECREEREAGER